ncbi:MAG TPA: radical SAM protein, partial [bacterium]|nr:radical SAM protein [bacterium]
MTDSEQLAYIEKMPGCEMFSEKLKAAGFFPVRAKEVEILQINTGRRCNLSCRHCHVEAGPSRKEMMSEETLWRCFEAIKKNPGINTADITGGAPEMNPHLERFLDEVSRLGKRTIVRSNLVILLEPEYSRFLDAYVRNRVEVVCSLPDFRKEKTDRQRGEGHFGKCLRVLGMLNKEGYGEPG